MGINLNLLGIMVIIVKGVLRRTAAYLKSPHPVLALCRKIQEIRNELQTRCLLSILWILCFYWLLTQATLTLYLPATAWRLSDMEGI
jgi:hypothetical protein